MTDTAHYTITTTQPISVPLNNAVRYHTASHDHIPGSAIRGALAGLWIRHHGRPQDSQCADRESFISLFEGDVMYGPALHSGNCRVPLSVHVCKYHPSPECENASIDEAFEPRWETCKHCEGPLTPSKGTMLRSIPTLIRQRTAIDDRTGTAAQSQLYSQELIQPGTTLSGTITGLASAPDQADWWNVANGADIRIGAGRTSMGGARIAIELGTSPGEPGQNSTSDSTAEREVTFVFHSDAIILDDYGRASLDVMNEIRRRLSGHTVKEGQTWTRAGRVAGWHVAAGLPKPEEHTVSAGSVIQFTTNASEQTLEELVHRGIGHRRREGFGRIERVFGAWQPPSLIRPNQPEDQP